MALGAATEEAATGSGFTVSGTSYTVVAYLIKLRSAVTQVEIDNRILLAEFDPGLFHAHMARRIVVEDWLASAGGGGAGGCPDLPATQAPLAPIR